MEWCELLPVWLDLPGFKPVVLAVLVSGLRVRERAMGVLSRDRVTQS